MVVFSESPMSEANESFELRFSLESNESDPLDDHATVKG